MVTGDSLAVEDVGIATPSAGRGDALRLHARLVRFPGATRAVLFCHGTGGNVARVTDFALALSRAARAHVLVFDYRGYGRSEGEPDEPGLEADARAALARLRPLVDVAPARTVVVGHSLGGAVAIDLAARTPDLGGLAVLSTFTSVEDMTRHLTGFAFLAELVPDKWDSREKVTGVTCPKLFLHGERDGFVPEEQGERLWTLAPPPKKLVVVPGATHDLWQDARAVAEIARFVAAVAPEPGEERTR